ncbi:hypothetical protein [Paenibacillus urinalis]|uniref:Thymidylate kinase n=1 Tax=Paenibacillus urinalis TaxID=521520 RepID=A0AAX3N0G5_9BACL|nr:hypothetical protein [Paenibacillus urinalis]WDH83331.1 hypothetical protein PUW23_03545 [Paenibacillus urinalis]
MTIKEATRTGSVPVYTVAVEGPDGAGKTSLIRTLRRSFEIIEPPKSSAFQLMPEPLEERIAWFRKEDPFITARIYMQAHAMRFRLASEYAAGRKHYLTARANRFDAPPVYAFDRGPLSMNAYVYAYLKEDTGLSDEMLHRFIQLQERSLVCEAPMLTILLLPGRPDDDAVTRHASRLAAVPVDADRERRLIANQLSYYCEVAARLPKDDPSLLWLDPFATPGDNAAAATAVIAERLQELRGVNRRSLKEHSNASGGKIYLKDLLQRLGHVRFSGRVYLVGGIVEKGYSDNDADLLVEKQEDADLLKTVFERETNHVHIELPRALDDELKEGKNVWYLQVTP